MDLGYPCGGAGGQQELYWQNRELLRCQLQNSLPPLFAASVEKEF